MSLKDNKNRISEKLKEDFSNKIKTKKITKNKKSANIKTDLKPKNITKILKNIYIPYANEKEIPKLIEFFKLLNPNYKEKVCSSCLNHKEFLFHLKIKIYTAIQEIKQVVKKPLRKSDLVEYFSDKINKVNLIDINLNHLKSNLKLQKDIGCNDYEEIKALYDASLQASNSLVEAIQKSIRTLNLNISFFIIH